MLRVVLMRRLVALNVLKIVMILLAYSQMRVETAVVLPRLVVPITQLVTLMLLLRAMTVLVCS